MKVWMYTKAYNAEQTLERTIESVLGQTHKDFDYYLLDNGSTDGTRAIMEHYRAKDSRIKILSNDVNQVHALLDFEKVKEVVLASGVDYQYFALLDADDTYRADFLEKTISYSEANNIDVCAVSSRFVEADTQKELFYRRLGTTIISTAEEWGDFFPYYYDFVRTVWGKLFSMRVIKSMAYDAKDAGKMTNGVDTYFSLNALKAARRFAILEDVLHQYYAAPTTAEHTYYPNRAYSYQAVHQQTLDLLQTKVGKLSHLNQECASGIFLMDVHSALMAVSKQPPEVQRQEVQNLADMTAVRRVLNKGFKLDNDRAVQSSVVNYMNAFDGVDITL